MLCITVAIASLFVAHVSSALPTAADTKKIDLFMPDIQVPKDDAYMCLPVRIADDQSLYITGFEPKADMSISHHMLLYGCEEAGDQSGKPFSCTQMDHGMDGAKPTCTKGSSIIYAWAMGAPQFELPKDVAFKVGKNTQMKTLVLQMHFTYNGTYKGGSGLSLTAQNKPTPQVAGIYLMATGGLIPAHSVAYLETACEYTQPAVLKPFAYRVHTHTLGQVVSGYRVRDDEWTELGRKNPQLPQMFYPLSTPGIDIESGDVLAARCTMKNDGNREMVIGATKNDEMCNFYLMYAVPNTAKSQALMRDVDGCFNSGFQYSRSEWRRNFGISSGFPADSTQLPAGDAELAKTMGAHMQMEMGQMDHDMQNMEDEMNGEMEDTQNELDNFAIDDLFNSEDDEMESMHKRHMSDY